MKGWGKSVQIAATYIGTVVGAGFASGQEILAFFTSYGPVGTLGIGIATALFVWLGYRMMVISARIGSPSYESFNKALFGPVLGRVINVLVFLTLFGVTTVMLAGSGSVLEEQFGVHYLLGIAVTSIAAWWILNKGLTRLLALNAVVVPMMLLFSSLIAATDSRAFPLPAESPDSYAFLWRAVLYVSFNLAMAQSVLVPIGSHVRDPLVLRRAAILGGAGLGFMLLAAHGAMLANWEEVRILDIPMVYITDRWSEWLQLFFVLVLLAEIFTTLISNVFGIAQQLREVFNWEERRVYIGLFTVGFGFCLFGYSQLLMFLYPLFGYLGLGTLIRMMFPGVTGRPKMLT